MDEDMAKAAIPHFQNDGGVARIEIGVKAFMCVGASDPYDHPHVYLDMGDDEQKVCPYCSTLFVFKDGLKAEESNPPNCLLNTEAA